MIKLYNTLTRSVDELKTLENKKVKLYTCGLTVYGQPHIGNWVGYIYWDVLQSVLEESGYEVNRVQNITDVGHLVSDDDNGEDKMEKGAKSEGLTAWEVADKYIEISNHEGFELLGLKKPKLVRATDCIQEQIDFVKVLEDKGFTYEIPDEGVYFDTSKLTDYGKLARIDIDGLEAGSRVPFKNKRNVTDFALWKFSPVDQTRDMEWDSPWGKGFPGWHLECSTIAMENLGEQIDIHTGGVDHIPIHHTNEIAQTESYTGKTFSTFWIHNNHLKVDGAKMSKSLENIYTLQDILDKGFSIEAFKLLILSKNYHTEGNFTWDNLNAAQNRLNELYSWADLRHQPSADSTSEKLDEMFRDTKSGILKALRDNLNTPQALIELNRLVSYMQTIPIPGVEGEHTKGTLAFLDRMFGLGLDNRPDITDEQKNKLKSRESAKLEKDFKTADELRATLEEQGIGINDTANGQVWFRL